MAPTAVMTELLGTIFTVQSYVVAAIGAVALATLATTAHIFTPFEAGTSAAVSFFISTSTVLEADITSFGA